MLIPHDAVFRKALSNRKEVESRGGRIIVVTDAPSPELEDVAWETMTVPSTNELLTPILLTIPLQLLAYHVAVYRGIGRGSAAQPGEETGVIRPARARPTSIPMTDASRSGIGTGLPFGSGHPAHSSRPVR